MLYGHMHGSARAHTRANTQNCSLLFPPFFFYFLFFTPCLFFTLFLALPLFAPYLFPPPSHLSPPVYLSSAPLYSPLFLSVPCSRLCWLVSLPGDGIMKNAPIDRAPQLRLAEMGHDRPRSILIPSYNVSTNESISAKFSIFQKPTRETGISSFVKILLSISSAI